ncbi:hypothetical protein [Streptomyces mirabilis]|uniref:hypothetical protein n=1 Tax=Streptomyces mirabilis TaxID=68239 RepID=UPI00380DFD0F
MAASTSPSAPESASAPTSEAPGDPLGAARPKAAALSGTEVDGCRITAFPAKPDGGATALGVVVKCHAHIRSEARVTAAW